AGHRPDRARLNENREGRRGADAGRGRPDAPVRCGGGKASGGRKPARGSHRGEAFPRDGAVQSGGDRPVRPAAGHLRHSREGEAMRRLLALILAYIPSATSLLKHTAGRAQALGRTREVTLSGVLFVSGEPQRNAQLVLRFPLQCRLDGEGGLSLSVKGTVENP